MTLTLFNIKDEYRKIADAIIEAGGELTPELNEALVINQAQLMEKAANYGYIIKQGEYEIDMLDSEIERLTALKKSRQNMIDRLKTTIGDAMELYGVQKLESDTIKLSFRKSEAVEITDETAIPSAYLIPQPNKVSKTAIKESILKGFPVPGATIVTKFNLQVK